MGGLLQILTTGPCAPWEGKQGCLLLWLVNGNHFDTPPALFSRLRAGSVAQYAQRRRPSVGFPRKSTVKLLLRALAGDPARAVSLSR